MRLPRIGFGCSPFRAGGRRVDLEAAVRAAVSAGYRLFDVAELYGNERAVGRALRHADARGALVVVGKLWRTNARPEAVRAACEGSLSRLGVDAFDLYLVHAPGAWRHVGPLVDAEDAGWPELERRALPRDSAGAPLTDDVPLADTWEAMRDLVRRGLAAAIGVSNFEPASIEELGPDGPAVNQIASSPYAPNEATADWCRRRGIGLLAHSPLSPEGLLVDPRLGALAGRLGHTPAQVVLRWNVQRGLVPLPSSADPEHIAQNLRALDFELAPADLAALDALTR